jgi:cell filamentation protein
MSADPYLIPNTETLKNLKNITDAEELEHEADTLAKINTLAIKNMPFLRVDWDINFYKDLHKTLFGSIYSWAGEYRTIDVGIAHDHVAYEGINTAQAKIENVFDYLNQKYIVSENGKKHLKEVDSNTKKMVLAIVYGSLKNFQPFRDGNTRTAALFTSILASNWGLAIDWNMVAPPPKNASDFVKKMMAKDYQEFCQEQVAFRDNDPNPLIRRFLGGGLVIPLSEHPELRYPRVTTYTGKSISEQIDQREKAVQNLRSL